MCKYDVLVITRIHNTSTILSHVKCQLTNSKQIVLMKMTIHKLPYYGNGIMYRSGEYVRSRRHYATFSLFYIIHCAWSKETINHDRLIVTMTAQFTRVCVLGLLRVWVCTIFIINIKNIFLSPTLKRLRLAGD